MVQTQLAETREFKELSDIDLVERIQTALQEQKRFGGVAERGKNELVLRLTDRGVTEAEIGERLVTIGPKMLAEYDVSTLAGLKKTTTDEQIFKAVTQVPSGKQLRAISDQAGATAKAVIASAKRKIETDKIVVKFKKPRRNGRRTRRR